MPIVRLKPYNPRLGHRLRKFVDGAHDGARYDEGHWYEVHAAVAEHLSWFMQDTSRVDPKAVVTDRARAFDLFATRADAEAVSEDELRGQLVPGQLGLSRVYTPPGRDAPEGDAPLADLRDRDRAAETAIKATDYRGQPRDYRGPPGPAPAQTTRSLAEPAPPAGGPRPPTAQQRRDAKIAEVTNRKTSGKASP